jgi:hypothetical protein
MWIISKIPKSRINASFLSDLRLEVSIPASLASDYQPLVAVNVLSIIKFKHYYSKNLVTNDINHSVIATANAIIVIKLPF